MAMITASLERSLQKCSLYQNSNIADDTDTGGGVGFSSSSSYSPKNHLFNFHDTREIYYINWRTGMKSKEDLRTAAVMVTEY
ncbi:hypothetical protein ACSBR1_006960 [Camellia fascicularis]